MMALFLLMVAFATVFALPYMEALTDTAGKFVPVNGV